MLLKKLFITFALLSFLFACKKETITTNNTGNNTADTVKTITDVSIAGFDCAGVKVSGTLTKDNAASNVRVWITYTGGNGKAYVPKSHSSTGVVGLSATLSSGTLANGNGTLMYTISGTPTSAGIAYFAIDRGGQSCTIKIPVEDGSSTNNNAFISGLDCAGATITGKLTKYKVASNVTASITYKVGNGKPYLSNSYPSSGISGLTAILKAGTLAYGQGTLYYTISGTASSAGTANFQIDLGGESCSISINVEDVSQNPTSSYGPIIYDIDGNSYKTIYIGTQQWMAENLKTTRYNNGTTIPKITDNNQWSQLTTGAWTYYNNDEFNNAKYGKLYNWYAVSPTTNGNKNVCPTGWHVPSDAEWTELIDFLGGKNVAGGKMKEVGTTSWSSPNSDATNTSLFTGLPGGYRYVDGKYSNIGYHGFWWSSTGYNTGSSARLRFLVYNSGDAVMSGYYSVNGLSVRCIKD
jgi:uncharacterized protein (TIGR02145 family)